MTNRQIVARAQIRFARYHVEFRVAKRMGRRLKIVARKKGSKKKYWCEFTKPVPPSDISIVVDELLDQIEFAIKEGLFA